MQESILPDLKYVGSYTRVFTVFNQLNFRLIYMCYIFISINSLFVRGVASVPLISTCVPEICHRSIKTKKLGKKAQNWKKKRGKGRIAEKVQTLLVTLFKTKAVVFPLRCLDYANTRRRKFSQPCVAYVKTVWKTVQPFYERGVAWRHRTVL